MLPNFFLIGANKAGTTSVHQYLKAHPDVYMSSPKEPSYWHFGNEVADVGRYAEAMITDRAEYEALFDGVRGETVIGESSTTYLQSARAPDRIHAEIPDARFLAILRDPSDRAYSAYCMHVAKGFEPIDDFDAALTENLNGGTWRHYIGMGRYADGLQRWFDRFGRDRVKVFLFEDLGRSSDEVLRETFTFLDVDPDFRPDLSRRANVTTFQRSAVVGRLTKGSSRTKTALRSVLPSGLRADLKRRATQWNARTPGPLTAEARARLVEVYSEDIERTEALIGRDLSAWRSV